MHSFFFFTLLLSWDSQNRDGPQMTGCVADETRVQETPRFPSMHERGIHLKFIDLQAISLISFCKKTNFFVGPTGLVEHSFFITQHRSISIILYLS